METNKGLFTTKYPRNKKFDGVTISGGGNKGLMSLGTLCYYYSTGKYDPKHVTVYSGTSIGAIIVTLLACGLTPPEIFHEIMINPMMFETSDATYFLDIVNEGYIMSNKYLKNKITALIIKKMGFIPTYEELYNKTNIVLVVVVTNVTKLRGEYYSHRTVPSMSVVDGAIASSCVPLLFNKSTHNGDSIIDGGLIDNFPVEEINDGNREILGIAMHSERKVLHKETGVLAERMNFIYGIMFLPFLNNMKNTSNTAGDNVTIVDLTWNKSGLIVKMTEEDIKLMFSHGWNYAQLRDQTIELTFPNYFEA